METIFSGLFLLLFLEKANKYGSNIYYILAGIFAGITLYGYHYGRILVIGIFLYLIFGFLKRKNWNFNYFKKVLLFSTSAVIIFLPLLINIKNNHGQAILRRPKATYAFAQNKVLGTQTIKNILWHQI